MDELASLKRLHDSGALSEEEYAAEKAALLHGDAEPVPSGWDDEPDEGSQSGRRNRIKAIVAILAVTIIVFTGTWWFISSNTTEGARSETDAVGAPERAIASAEARLNELDDRSVLSTAVASPGNVQDTVVNGVSAPSTLPDPPSIERSWVVGWWERGGDGSCPGDSAEEFISDGTWSAWGEGGEWRLDGSQLVLSVTRSKEGYSDTGERLASPEVKRGNVDKRGAEAFTWNVVAGAPIHFRKCIDTDE